MYRLLIDALCLDCHSALLLSEEANNEAVIESAVGLILRDFLGDVAIDEITVTGTPAIYGQESRHQVRVQATSLNEVIDMPITLLEARLEEAICCALLEHFDTVLMNAVDVYHESDDESPITHE